MVPFLIVDSLGWNLEFCLPEIFEEDVAEMGCVFIFYEHGFCMCVVQDLGLACLHLKSERSGSEWSEPVSPA